MRICKNDQVIVLIGASSGKKSRVVSVDTESQKVVVEGVAVVRKHVRRSQRNPKGGRLAMEMPIPMSNVQVICPSCTKPTRVGVTLKTDGTKHRVCKKCKAEISQIGGKSSKQTISSKK